MPKNSTTWIIKVIVVTVIMLIIINNRNITLVISNEISQRKT